MSFPDNFSQRAYDAHYAYPRDLTPTELRQIRELRDGINLARRQKGEMASLPDSGAAFGPADAGAYYDDMIRDMLFEIARIESRPVDEIAERSAAA